MDDEPALEAYLAKKVPEKFRYQLWLAVIQGTGAGQPLGIQNSDCFITVAKESGQSPDTLVNTNIASMITRFHSCDWAGAKLLVSPEAFGQFPLFKLSDSADSFGMPWWSASAQPRVGSNTASPFVTLQERA
jgi:HK97 family phage major capsid protein